MMWRVELSGACAGVPERHMLALRRELAKEISVAIVSCGCLEDDKMSKKLVKFTSCQYLCIHN